ncbi:MAG: N-acetyl-gamma-glutamyl-phosphate reductase, partial [Muribaculaceae bacterium]|nr:N-acetyl-gamma-glutamyl-phosphate reductase [Muribaculaceae bacterium]
NCMSCCIRAFRDIRVPKLLFLKRNTKKISYFYARTATRIFCASCPPKYMKEAFDIRTLIGIKSGGIEMIKAGIIGATGYAGGELVRILAAHKDVEIVWYGSRSYVGQRYAEVYRNLFEIVDDACMDDNLEELAGRVDVIFTATPQGFCASMVNEGILSRTKLVDLSADFRIKDVSVYEKWYGIEHKAPQYIEEAVYGLCEINREDIKKARLTANPGCYTTCSILTAYPLVKEGLIDADTLIIDAKSGVSGAGRGAKVPNLYCEVNENSKAYGVAGHRHTPEIEEQLGYAAGRELLLNFTPHLVPMNRGILVTEYAKLKEVQGADGGVRLPSYEEIRAVYDRYYGREKFVRVLDEGVCPETRWVEGSNYVDINFVIDERTRRIIMMGALDNLVKGAAGQAVQNMNLMFGLPEGEGLELVPVFP